MVGSISKVKCADIIVVDDSKNIPQVNVCFINRIQHLSFEVSLLK